MVRGAEPGAAAERRRVALVTGGAVRVGRATVEELAGAGWAVAFTYRHSAAAADQLADSLRALGARVAALPVDLDDPAARNALVDEVVARFGRLDALVNNAAVFPPTPLEGLDEEVFNRVMRTNLEAPLFLTRTCAPWLRQVGGAVVNIADIHGLRPLRGYLAYSVSKAALIAATRALAVELAPAVRVNAIAPGIAQFPDGWDEAKRRRLVDRTPLRRAGSPAEIARAVRYLLEGTATATGEVLVIDAGRSLTW